MTLFSGLFFEKHLKYIKLSESFVPFSKRDLTYLLKDNYDKMFINEVYQTPIVTFEELRRGTVSSKGPVRIQYNSRNQFKSAAKSLGIMDDFKVWLKSINHSSKVDNFLHLHRAASHELHTMESCHRSSTINESIWRQAPIGRATIHLGANRIP